MHVVFKIIIELEWALSDVHTNLSQFNTQWDNVTAD